MEGNYKSGIVSHKRRSSIFQSRVILFDHENEGKHVNSDEQRIFNLQEYMDTLREERQTWKNIYKERKMLKRKLLKQKKDMETDGQNFDMNVLSDSEKSLFSTAPNYDQIHNNLKNMFDMTSRLSLLNHLYQQLNEKFLLKMDEKLCNTTKAIIKTTKISK